MHKVVLILVVIMSTMFIGCEAVRQIRTGCYGYWEDSGIKRGTRGSRKTFVTPYRQCVDENPPHRNTEKRPYG